MSNDDIIDNSIPKKTRGRKKKCDIDNSNNVNQQETSLEDLENLQIEQVKKKRGRKKKWEVETTTKLIENGPISFSENIIKDNSKTINSNYEAQSISFGNLNIKVHTNKEQVTYTSIKDTLQNIHLLRYRKIIIHF